MKTLIWETHDDGAYATTPAELLADNQGDEGVADAIAYLKTETKKRSFMWAGVRFGGGAGDDTCITVRLAGARVAPEDEIMGYCLHESDVPRRGLANRRRNAAPRLGNPTASRIPAGFVLLGGGEGKYPYTLIYTKPLGHKGANHYPFVLLGDDGRGLVSSWDEGDFRSLKSQGYSASGHKVSLSQLPAAVRSAVAHYIEELPLRAAARPPSIKRRTPNALDETRRKAEGVFAESDRQMQEQANAAARGEAEARARQAAAQRQAAEAEAARQRAEAEAYARARAEGAAAGRTGTLQRRVPLFVPDTDSTPQDAYNAAYAQAFRQSQNDPEAQRRRAEAERQRQQQQQQQQQQQPQQSQQRPPLKERKALFTPNPPPFADHRRTNPAASRFVLLDAGPSAGHHGANERYTLICTAPQGSGSRSYYNYLGFGTGVSGHGEFTASDFRAFKAEGYRSLGKRIKIESLPASFHRLAERFMSECG